MMRPNHGKELYPENFVLVHQCHGYAVTGVASTGVSRGRSRPCQRRVERVVHVENYCRHSNRYRAEC